MFIILQMLTSVKEITLVTWMLYAWTPKDLMFVLVTPDILEMEATAQVIDVFLLKPFPSERKALSYLWDLFYQHTLYWPFHSWHLISNSAYCLPHNSYDVSSKNLVLNQLIIPKLIFFLILVTCLFDIVMIW